MRPYRTCLLLDNRPGRSEVSVPRGFSWFFARHNQAWSYSTWLQPNDKRFKSQECELVPKQGPYAARSRHPAGVNLLFADGAVEFTHQEIDAATWKMLGTCAGEELPGDD